MIAVNYLLSIQFIRFIFYISIYCSMNIFISSSTLVIPPIQKLSTKTLAAFVDKTAGSVDPRCIFLTHKFRLC